MKKKHLVVLFCLFGSLSASAQNKMVPETLWQMGRVSEPISAPDGKLVEYIEAPSSSYFVATQAHPEFRSRPTRPHPLFVGLVKAAMRDK